jgi:hypothetical protein
MFSIAAHRTIALALLVACGAAACATHRPPASLGPSAPPVHLASVRAEVQAAIDRGVEATRRQDIEAYMAELPEDLAVRNDSGRVLTRDELRADVLRSWAIIPRTLAIQVVIDSLHLLAPASGGAGDSVAVWTSQRWERLMRRRDGITVDTVLTTQRHRETWRRTTTGWRQYVVEELGGEVWLNGKPYRP